MEKKIIDVKTATLADCEELYSYGIITKIDNGQITKFEIMGDDESI